MAVFKGYLIKLGDVELPNKFIQYDSYKSTDNQRTELKANRDTSNFLHRQTSPNFKTKIEFNTVELHLSDLTEIKNIIAGATINTTERKVRVTYWNNENLVYKTMIAYMPDFEYNIKNVTKNDIVYKPLRIAFIQY